MSSIHICQISKKWFVNHLVWFEIMALFKIFITAGHQKRFFYTNMIQVILAAGPWGGCIYVFILFAWKKSCIFETHFDFLIFISLTKNIKNIFSVLSRILKFSTGNKRPHNCIIWVILQASITQIKCLQYNSYYTIICVFVSRWKLSSLLEKYWKYIFLYFWLDWRRIKNSKCVSKIHDSFMLII